MGHLLHGGSLASLSHVLRYGFRTMRGSTGGVSLEASHVLLSKAEARAAAVVRYPRIGVCLREMTMASDDGGTGVGIGGGDGLKDQNSFRVRTTNSDGGRGEE